MNRDEWDSISILLDKGFKWREPFGEVQAAAYNTLLAGHSANEIMGAVRKLVANGQVFGPTPGEIVASIHEDVSVPTFPEFQTMIYGPGGVITAGKRGVNDLRRSQMAETGSSWIDQGDQKRALDHAAQAHADRLHQLVGSFVARYGLARLRNLELDDPEYGMLRRKDLEREWGEHVEISGHRDAAHIASGDRRGELGRFDPLEYLRQPTAPALGRGEEAA